MAIPQDEPKSPEQGQQWVGKHAREHDRFAHVAAKYDGHRATHGCYDVYPYPNGSFLEPWRQHTVADAYSKSARSQLQRPLVCLWRRTRNGVESVERDPQHAAIAIDHFKAEGLGERLKVLAGLGAEVLPTLKDSYDLGYFDTDPASR